MLRKERVKSSCPAVDCGCCVADSCDDSEGDDDEDEDCDGDGDDCCSIGNDRRNGFRLRFDILVVVSILFVVCDRMNGSAIS